MPLNSRSKGDRQKTVLPLFEFRCFSAFRFLLCLRKQQTKNDKTSPNFRTKQFNDEKTKSFFFLLAAFASRGLFAYSTKANKLSRKSSFIDFLSFYSLLSSSLLLICAQIEPKQDANKSEYRKKLLICRWLLRRLIVRARREAASDCAPKVCFFSVEASCLEARTTALITGSIGSQSQTAANPQSAPQIL